EEGGVYTGGNAPPKLLAEVSPSFVFLSSNLAINDSGKIVFAASELATGNSNVNLADANGVQKIVATSSPYGELPFSRVLDPVINNAGTVAFCDCLTSVDGIYTGPDPSRDKVISTKDLLFGLHLITLEPPEVAGGSHY